MHECCKAVNGPKAMTSVMSLCVRLFFSFPKSRQHAFSHTDSMLLYAHTKRTTPMWKQDMPRRRVSVPQVQQRLPLRPYRKTSTTYVMAIDSTITLRNSYAQSQCDPVSWYYMLYSSIHNIYLIYRYTVIEYTYLFQMYSNQTIKSRKRAPITIN